MGKKIFTTILVLILLAGAAWFFWQTNKSKTPKTPTTAFSPQASKSTNTSPKPLVKTSTSAGLGEYLTDGDGRTLYINLKEKDGVSLCSAACAKAWPPYYNTKGIDVTSFKDEVSSRVNSYAQKDGTVQLAFGTNLLYYYSGDTKPGDILGSGLDNSSWQVVVIKPLTK